LNSLSLYVHKLRNVILFGAGAVIDWNGPTTPELTSLIRKCGFFIKGGKTTITDFIYQKLIDESDYPVEQINFETIINVIEELLVYYAEHGLRKQLPSLIKSFFNPRFEDEIMNYTVISEVGTNRYKLQFNQIEDKYATWARLDTPPQQFFLQLLLSELLTQISIRIEKYSYHAPGKSNVITIDNAAKNLAFQKWAAKLARNGILRMYSLNYDRNFKILVEKAHPAIPVFEGFECGHTVPYVTYLRPNVQRIIKDDECHTHYNLHGSIFWQIKALNRYGLPLPEYFLTSNAYLEVNTEEFPTFQSEKGKTVFLTNVVTGYQKTQRAIFSPFKQMQATLDKDCLFADRIIVIGYSFGDEHINSSIRTALQYNEKLKLEIIDPSFTKNEFDWDMMLKIFAASPNMENLPKRKSSTDV